MPQIPTLTPIATEPISVVLIVKDAASHLQATLNDWIAYLNGLDRPYEILLVDDKSRDASVELANLIAATSTCVRVLPTLDGGGDGAAPRAGFARVQYPLVFTCRLEPCFQPTIVRKLLQEIDKVHVVSGYRSGKHTPVAWRGIGHFWRLFTRVFFSYASPPLPGWLGWRRHLGQQLAWFFFGVLNLDVTSPVRLMRRDILARIPLQSDGVFVYAEILAKANFLGKLLSSDVPLGDRNNPVAADRQVGDSILRILADACRVFNTPDFGPAHLPSPEKDSLAPAVTPS